MIDFSPKATFTPATVTPISLTKYPFLEIENIYLLFTRFHIVAILVTGSTAIVASAETNYNF